MFAAGAFSNLTVSFTDAADALLDFENYDSVFKHVDYIKGLGGLKGQKNTAKEYYAEGKVLFVKAWGMGRIDTLMYFPDSSLFLSIRPTHNIALLNWYRIKNKDTFRFYIKNIHIDGYLTKIGADTCRIGIFAWAITRTRVPAWLISFVMRIIIPRFITDLERYVQKRIFILK